MEFSLLQNIEGQICSDTVFVFIKIYAFMQRQLFINYRVIFYFSFIWKIFATKKHSTKQTRAIANAHQNFQLSTVNNKVTNTAYCTYVLQRSLLFGRFKFH